MLRCLVICFLVIGIAKWNVIVHANDEIDTLELLRELEDLVEKQILDCSTECADADDPEQCMDDCEMYGVDSKSKEEITGRNNCETECADSDDPEQCMEDCESEGDVTQSSEEYNCEMECADTEDPDQCLEECEGEEINALEEGDCETQCADSEDPDMCLDDCEANVDVDCEAECGESDDPEQCYDDCVNNQLLTREMNLAGLFKNTGSKLWDILRKK